MSTGINTYARPIAGGTAETSEPPTQAPSGTRTSPASTVTATNSVALAGIEVLAKRTWRLFPCVPRSKEPLIRGWRALASCDIASIKKWAAKYPDCNWACATGAESGIFVLDIDDDAGRASLAALEEEHEPLPPTLTSSTGRGEHRWFNCPEDRRLGNSVGKLGAGLDVRASGGYVIVPPSIHQTGRVYEWLEAEQPTADAPNWLLNSLTKDGRKERSLPAPQVSILFEGQRNDGLFRHGCALRRKGRTREQIVVELRAANHRRCKPPLPSEDIEKIAASAARYKPGGPDPLQEAWRVVLTDPVPYGYEQFLALARSLQGARPGLMIALPLERIGELMRCDWTQVRRWRHRAVREGRLQLRERPLWRCGRSALYTFTDVPLAGKKCPTSVPKKCPIKPPH